MKTKSFLIAAMLFIFAAAASSQTTEITYQGKLNDMGSPATGTYQMQFTLHDAPAGGTQISQTITNNNVSVGGGVFTVTLAFTGLLAAPFDGGDRWLEIAVKKPADPSFTTLTPRQPVTSSPYSIKSLSANTATTATNALTLGGQPASSFALQTQVAQLQAELAAVTGGTQLWSRSFGNDRPAFGNSIAVDESGDVFVTGFFQESINFGGGQLLSAGSDDIFVAKYSGATGAHLWSVRFGGTSYDRGNGIAVNASGDVFITGEFHSSSINFGGGALSNNGGTDILLAKLSGNDGSHIWSRSFGSSFDDRTYAVAASPAGDAVITGVFFNTVNFGGLPLVSAGSTDIVVAKYSGATSSHLWSRRFGGTLSEDGRGIAVDGSGNVFVTGDFSSSSINFGGGVLTNAGNGDGYLAKLAGVDGGHLWSKRFGGTNLEQGKAVAVDSNGSVLVTGDFTSAAIDLGGGPRANSASGNYEVFLAKYSSVGTHQWSKAIGGINNDSVKSVALDSGGNPVIAGEFLVSTNLGGISLNSAGNFDIFAAKYLAVNGSHQWSRRFGGSINDFGYSLAVDNSGDVFMTGIFASSAIDFGGGPLVNDAQFDIFVAKLRR